MSATSDSAPPDVRISPRSWQVVRSHGSQRGSRPTTWTSPDLTMWKPAWSSCPRWQAVAVSTDETPLAIWGSGAAASKAHRRQNVVLHTSGPWSRSVMALLKHLQAVGFDGAPRPVGDGFDADGRLLLDAYGLPAAERVGFADRMIEFAVYSARSEAVRRGVTPDTATAVDPSGYPVLWAITWRARSASWMLRHRQILERALM